MALALGFYAKSFPIAVGLGGLTGLGCGTYRTLCRDPLEFEGAFIGLPLMGVLGGVFWPLLAWGGAVKLGMCGWEGGKELLHSKTSAQFQEEPKESS